MSRLTVEPNFTKRKPQSRHALELWSTRGVAESVTVSLLCSLTVRLSAISERFSSSSLPPSFAQRRRTTVFLAGGAAGDGAPFLTFRRAAAAHA